jgi:dinuclear metal center YbgI/SA1388 family protein
MILFTKNNKTSKLPAVIEGMVTIKDITTFLENFAPLPYQESYDNSGLLTGDGNSEVKGILITLDCTEAIVEEAIKRGCNLIIAHHPVIFKGLKKITGKNEVERTVIKAIKNDVALYAIHTNLDNIKNGVSFKIAEKLKLKNVAILDPKKNLLQKLVTFVPAEFVEKVMTALFAAGAGKIGNYQNCSFKLDGTGTFEPDENSNPFIGSIGRMESAKETRIEVILPSHKASRVINNLLESHPYETPAYDIFNLENDLIDVGSGAIGELETPLEEIEFLKYLKENMNLQCFKHTSLRNKPIKKVAVCGGA